MFSTMQTEYHSSVETGEWNTSVAFFILSLPRQCQPKPAIWITMFIHSNQRYLEILLEWCSIGLQNKFSVVQRKHLRYLLIIPYNTLVWWKYLLCMMWAFHMWREWKVCIPQAAKSPTCIHDAASDVCACNSTIGFKCFRKSRNLFLMC